MSEIHKDTAGLQPNECADWKEGISNALQYANEDGSWAERSDPVCVELQKESMMSLESQIFFLLSCFCRWLGFGLMFTWICTKNNLFWSMKAVLDVRPRSHRTRQHICMQIWVQTLWCFLQPVWTLPLMIMCSKIPAFGLMFTRIGTYTENNLFWFTVAVLNVRSRVVWPQVYKKLLAFLFSLSNLCKRRPIVKQSGGQKLKYNDWKNKQKGNVYTWGKQKKISKMLFELQQKNVRFSFVVRH